MPTDKLIEQKATDFVEHFERLWSQNATFLGKALQCHLMIEWAITMFLESQLRSSTKWEDARLSFSQKLNLTDFSGSPVTKFIKGIKAVNKLRNALAHSPDWRGIKFPDLTGMKTELLEYMREQSKPAPDPFPDGLHMVELFTHVVCPFIAGASTVKRDEVLLEVIANIMKAKKPKAHNKRINPRSRRSARSGLS